MRFVNLNWLHILYFYLISGTFGLTPNFKYWFCLPRFSVGKEEEKNGGGGELIMEARRRSSMESAWILQWHWWHGNITLYSTQHHPPPPPAPQPSLYIIIVILVWVLLLQRYSIIKAGVNATMVQAFDINDVANDVYQHNFGHRPHQVRFSPYLFTSLLCFPCFIYFIYTSSLPVPNYQS